MASNHLYGQNDIVSNREEQIIQKLPLFVFVIVF